MEVKIYYRTVDKKHTFTGKKIEPPYIHGGMTVSELIDFFASTGYNARRLAEAAEIMKDMIDTNSTICLTLAGAMTPIGLGKSIGTMIANGFIDWIVTTGANVYHDMHFAYDLPVRQGHFEVDDDILYSKQIVRIYDVYIKEIETLQTQDYIIQNEIKKKSKEIPKVASTADIAYVLGKATKENSIFPEKSFIVSAYQHNVPIYIPAISDSSIGLNLLPLLFEEKGILPNVILDVAESDARPDTGGLSGATLQEGKSWGKIKTSHRGNVIVYGDATVYFPLLCSYVLSECKPRKPKELYKKKNSWVTQMKQFYRNNKGLNH